ncbi:MAG: calcium/sodium antiporter [Proteobacteria bacterium]|nr:calcium/sodium antiporter [Pseudomonadota bacterium]
MSFFLVLVGLMLLFGGGELLVRGSVALARRLGVSEIAVGVVLVGFGTSAPELLVSVEAAILNHPDLALGNVLGSNIANILLIVGVAAVVTPIRLSAGVGWREAAMVLVATTLVTGLALTGSLGLWQGVVMLAALGAYLLVCWRQTGPEDADFSEEDVPTSTLRACLLAFGGLVLLVLGADLLVDGAIVIARDMGVSEATIGLTIVAVGSSLPELAASTVAAFRGKSSVAIGNVLGSNLFNLLGALGIVAVIIPVSTAGADIRFSLLSMLALTGCFVALVAARHVGRLIGAVFLALYAAFVAMHFAIA